MHIFSHTYFFYFCGLFLNCTKRTPNPNLSLGSIVHPASTCLFLWIISKLYLVWLHNLTIYSNSDPRTELRLLHETCIVSFYSSMVRAQQRLVWNIRNLCKQINFNNIGAIKIIRFCEYLYWLQTFELLWYSLLHLN